MKTIMDAINELKGDISNSYGFIPNDDAFIYHDGVSASDNWIAFGRKCDVHNKDYRFICTREEFEYTVKKCETNFGTSYSYSNYKKEFYHINSIDSKPIPIYTQAMVENGELPTVGMECQTSTGVVTLLLPIDGDGMGVVMIDGEYCVICQSALLPLASLITLKDGMAYQFDYSHHSKFYGISGVYNKEEGVFYGAHDVLSQIHCTNITLLTPEVK